MPRQKISKEKILDTTYQMAVKHGLKSVNARSISAECGVSVGSIYNYFPSMDELYAKVIERFFQTMLSFEGFHTQTDQNYVVLCRSFYAQMKKTLRVFRHDWLNQIESMTTSMRMTGKAHESAYQKRIIDQMEHVLASDPDIDTTRFSAYTTIHNIATSTFYALVDSIRHEIDSKPIFLMLAYMLYTEDSDARTQAIQNL